MKKLDKVVVILDLCRPSETPVQKYPKEYIPRQM